MYHDPVAQEFFLYWVNQVKLEETQRWLRAMGLLWTREELFKPEVRPDDDVQEIMVPLGLVLNPDLVTNLRTWMNSDGRKSKGEHLVELGSLSREDFLNFYKNHFGKTGLKS